MTTTTFFKFADEAEAISVLQPEGYYIPESTDKVTREVTPGHYKTADLGWALDVVGIIWEGGEWDPDTGEELTPPVPLPGFHINFSGPYANGLDKYKIEPKRMIGMVPIVIL